jgi:hypothetical protein
MATSLLAAVSASPEILEYAQGAAQDNTNPVADFLAPTVAVSNPVGKFKKYDQKNRFKIPNTIRANTARAVEIGWTASDATYNCKANAIDSPLDIMEIAAMGSMNADEQGVIMEDAMKEASLMVAEVGGLAHEANVISAATNVLQAAGGAQYLTPTWTKDVDIVDQIDAQVLNVLKAARYGSLIGIRILFGASIMRYFKNHPLVRNRYIVGGAQARGPAVAPLAALDEKAIGSLFIGVPELRVSYMVQDTAEEGLAASINFLLDNAIIVFAAKNTPTRRDPSFMKTFRLAGKWMVPGSYLRDDQRVEVAKFDWSEDIQVTNSQAGVMIVPILS